MSAVLAAFKNSPLQRLGRSRVDDADSFAEPKADSVDDVDRQLSDVMELIKDVKKTPRKVGPKPRLSEVDQRTLQSLFGCSKLEVLGIFRLMRGLELIEESGQQHRFGWLYHPRTGAPKKGIFTQLGKARDYLPDSDVIGLAKLICDERLNLRDATALLKTIAKLA